MEHIPYEGSNEQRANLEKLAAFLRTVDPEKFDMARYREDHSYPYEPQSCGTAACAAGYGPLAGIPALPDEDWSEYVYRNFYHSSFSWCFSNAWADIDNTPQGAAARIRYMLDHGIPRNAYEQIAASFLAGAIALSRKRLQRSTSK